MLKTKCIFDEVSKEDGWRISVMSRNTLNDGKTPDTRIVPNVTYNERRIELAPPGIIVGAWHRSQKTKEDWDKFTREYLNHLSQPAPANSLRQLAEMALRRDVTILCVELRGENCHRLILAQKCRDLEPELEVRHL
jgi:uncharacterized protein YeaO (DUF488 family)